MDRGCPTERRMESHGSCIYFESMVLVMEPVSDDALPPRISTAGREVDHGSTLFGLAKQSRAFQRA
eukprot:10105454-Karenia_brevis.AAC.1